jgi:hypothetical protein
MTPIQKLIHDYILIEQPICDKCIAQSFGYNNPQQANSACRQLCDLKITLREKGYCPCCNRNVIINFVVI